MKKLALVVSVIFTTQIISYAPVDGRPRYNLPVGKMALPTDRSVNNWCVTNADHGSAKFSKQA